MTRLPLSLLKELRQLVQTLPTHELERLALSLEKQSSTVSPASLVQPIAKAAWRDAVLKMLECWQKSASSVTGVAIASALDAMRYEKQQRQGELSLELAWTGPNPSKLPLRRTDQVLLELIRTAKKELWLASFAVYDISEIVQALHNALAKGIKLNVIIEDPKASNNKITFGALHTFGHELLQKASFWYWPLEQRQQDSKGRHGSLHMKCAISDGKNLFISSANLTQYAMELNMELGVLIRSEHQAQELLLHLRKLTSQEVLVLVK